MAEKPKQQFGTRIPTVAPSSPSSPPAKRSGHVALLVMGTLAVGSTAFVLMPRECTPAEPGATPGQTRTTGPTVWAYAHSTRARLPKSTHNWRRSRT